MEDESLSRRVRNHLTRQIASFEKMREELRRLNQTLEEGELEVILAAHKTHVQETARLDQEFHRLLEEWRNASEVTEAERGEIRVLARRAEGLTQELAALYQEAVTHVGNRSERIRAALSELAQGRVLLCRYDPNILHDASFDEKA